MIDGQEETGQDEVDGEFLSDMDRFFNPDTGADEDEVLEDDGDQAADQEVEDPLAELETDEAGEAEDAEEEAPDAPDDESNQVETGEEEEVDDEQANLDLPALRKLLRERGKELKRSQREIELINERAVAAERARAASQLQKPDPNSDYANSQNFSTDDLITYLARAESGDAKSDHRAQALAYLEYKDPAEIVAVARRARLGSFGDLSRDIELVASDVLPMVQAVSSQRQTEVQSQQQWNAVYQQSLRSLLDSEVTFLPDGSLDRTNEATVQYERAGHELTELIPSLSREAKAPGIVLQYMQLKNQASQAERIPELESEVAELKARLAEQTSSLPKSNGSKPTGKTAKTAEEILEEEIKSAWGV
jgi:hypothetical protein